MWSGHLQYRFTYVLPVYAPVCLKQSGVMSLKVNDLTHHTCYCAIQGLQCSAKYSFPALALIMHDLVYMVTCPLTNLQ